MINRDDKGTNIMATTTSASANVRYNPPAGWWEQKDGTLACPHRDTSVCRPCAAANVEAVDVHGAHFWIATEDERAELAALAAPSADTIRWGR